MSQAHFWMEKWEHCELLWMDFPLTRNYSLAKDIFARCSCCQCFRIVAVAGAGKTTTCIKLADRLLRQDPDLRIASLGLSLRWDEGGWNTLELETLASCFSLGFLWRGGKWMGDDGFLRFGFVLAFILQGVTVVWATISVHICKCLFWRLWGLRKLPSYLWIHLNWTATAEGTFPSKIHENSIVSFAGGHGWSWNSPEVCGL